LGTTSWPSTIGKISNDQVEGYARRKGMDLPVVERWLSPNQNDEIEELRWKMYASLEDVLLRN
jgi:hypothetical protein